MTLPDVKNGWMSPQARTVLEVLVFCCTLGYGAIELSRFLSPPPALAASGPGRIESKIDDLDTRMNAIQTDIAVIKDRLGLGASERHR